MTLQVLLSKREAAHALAISLRSLEYLIARKELPVRRIGRRVLVLASSCQQFARRDHTDALSGAIAEEK